MTVIEQTVLLAVLEEDREEAERLLSGFLPGELRTLETACERLAGLVRRRVLLTEHEAGEHTGMAYGPSYGPHPAYGEVHPDAEGCPKCHEIAGIDPPGGAW